jgi:glycosyltransferase involved in cell wall biosynthesis
MRIAHVVSALLTGGAQMMLAKLLEAGTDPADQLVIVLRPGGGLWERVVATGARVEHLGLAAGELSPLALWRLACLLRAWRPELVHGWMYHGNLAALLAAAMTGRRLPVIWNIRHSLHDLAAEKPATRCVIRIGAPLSRYAATIVYNSAVGAAQHRAYGYAASAAVIPNGFDVEHFQPDAGKRAAVRTELGLTEASVLVGMIARDHPMKDHASLLQALAGLRASGLDLDLVLAGEGMDAANRRLAGLVRRAGLEDRVHLLGERADIPDLTAALDIAVLSSAWGEGFPNALGEAMACAVPCVATDVGDCRAILAGHGTIVPARDPAALGAAIGRLALLPAEGRAELGAAARRRVVAEYSLPAIATRYYDLYEWVRTIRATSNGLRQTMP